MSENRTAEQMLKARYKAQNEYNKENYERITVMAPKGTKDRIKATGEKSVNKFIVSSVLRSLDQHEKDLKIIEQTQAMIDEKRKQYEREKEAEQTQEDAQKTRLFNMNDYK